MPRRDGYDELDALNYISVHELADMGMVTVLEISEMVEQLVCAIGCYTGDAPGSCVRSV